MRAYDLDLCIDGSPSALSRAGLWLLVILSCGGPRSLAADSATERIAPSAPPSSALEIAPLLDEGDFAVGAALYARASWTDARAKLVGAAAGETDSERAKAARLVAALAAAQAGDHATARRELERLAAHWPLVAPLAISHAAQEALASGDADGAETLAQRVPRSGPYGATARLVLADAALARRELQRAEERYREYLADAHSPRRLHARYRLGDSIARQLASSRSVDPARLSEAVSELRAVSIQAPETRLAREAESKIAALVKRLPARERRRLMAVTPEQAFERAASLGRAQRHSEAEAAYLALLRELSGRSPLRCDAKLGLAEAVMRQRDRQRSVPLFEQAITACRGRTEQARCLFLAGKAHASIGDHERATARFAELEEHHHGSSLADDARLLGALSALAMGRAESFRASLRSLPTDYPQGDMRAEALWQLGWHAWNSGDPAATLEVLGGVSEVVGREEGWYAAGRAPYWRGRALAKLGRQPEALAAYEKVVREHPLTYYMLLALARIAQAEPQRARALWTEVFTDSTPQPGIPEEPGPQLVSAEGFQRALLLIRAGLGDLASRELVELGLDGSAATPEGLWLAAYLFDRAGSPSRSHEILRRRLTTFEQGYPIGTNRLRWTVAYPKAFAPLVETISKQQDVPEALLYAIMREESGFDPAVESWANAVGLTQLMPGTARRFGIPLGLDVSSHTLRDPETNLRIGAAFMAFLGVRFAGNVVLVPAGYNAGETAVKRWLDASAGMELDEWVESIPYDQTRGYTKRVVASYGTYRALYGPPEPPLVPLVR